VGRRVVYALLAIVVLVAFAAVVNLVVPIPGGPLSDGGNGLSAPKPAGKALTAGAFSLDNDGGRTLVIEEIDLPELEGVDYLGAVVRRGGPDAPQFVVEDGFPPPDPVLKVTRVQPAEGLRLGPHRSRELLLGFRGEPGDYRMTPVEVVYRMELLGGLGIRFRRKLSTEFIVCLRGGGVLADCPLAESSD
jgi:hypothetical protein